MILIAILNFFGWRAEAANSHAPYPEAWWKPVPPGEAASWEILPQDAGPGEVILSKRTELGIFSNFADTAFTYRGKVYASIEGFWQMMKYPEGPQDPRALYPGLHWDYTRDQVARMTGTQAKEAGNKANQNMVKMGIHWITFEGVQIDYKGADQAKHYQLILDVSWEKIHQNQNVKDLLLATGDLVLRPDHNPSADATPAYRYNEIYMKIRADLRH